MSCLCLHDGGSCDPPDGVRPDRACCLALLSTVIGSLPGGARGTAVFLLDCCGTRPGVAVLTEVARRLRAACPVWHRLLHCATGEFFVVAQGLVDGGAVLAAAARLVHAFDDALQSSHLALCTDVAIGISCAFQNRAHAEPLLAAAESALRESRAVARQGRRSGLAPIPRLGSVNEN